MAKTQANEREFAGQVIAWIKKQIEQASMPFSNATNDSSLYGLKQVKFPDVLLTLDFAGQQPFCGWELKTPRTDVRDKELLKNATEKAQALKAKYFVTWNMQTAIIWRTPEGTRATVTEAYKERELELTGRISHVNDLRDPVKCVLLQELCGRLIIDLSQLHHDENINLPLADTTVFVSIVSETSRQIAGLLLEDINRARSVRAFDKRLKHWAVKQGVNKYDQDYYHTLSQQIAYRLIGKILFYLTLRRHHLSLPPMELDRRNYQTASKQLRSLFQSALQVDYQSIFERDITDEIELSKRTLDIITNLTDQLTHWSFELMPLDVIGNVFEQLIPGEARHRLGQYFTPDRLADLIITFCLRHRDDMVMDPTCGTGTFLIRSYQRLQNLGRRNHAKMLNQIWGFDISAFPAELATINLCRQDFRDYWNFPRVQARDFFEVMPGAEFEFPPPKKTVKKEERIKVAIPQFDALVGNFPFIRQEVIEKEEKGYKRKLESILYESWGKDYPELFRVKTTGNNHKTIQELRLSGQADIYAYMYFQAAAHCKLGGRMGFVTSNSWLDVAYGLELQKFFLDKFKIITICESRCEPWFEHSAVNTVFTILERCDDKKAQEEHYVRFIKLKKPLQELFGKDPLTDTQRYWLDLEHFVDRSESLGAAGQFEEGRGYQKYKSISSEHIRQPEIISYEDDEVRMRLVRQKDLKEQIRSTSGSVKWGIYLRAPEVYFRIIEKCADILVPLGKIAEIRRGFTTGINDFFYLTPEQAQHWGIEKKYLKRVIKSPKEAPRIVINEKDLKNYIFLCNEGKEKLKGTKALRYIKWGESQTRNGCSWTEAPTVHNRARWYELPKREPGIILLPMISGNVLRCNINSCKVQVDHNLFELISDDEEIINPLAKYFNTCFSFLQRELIGRANLGDGALKTEGIDWKRILAPRLDVLLQIEKKARSSFNKLCRRDIKPISEEAKKKDRKDFEEKVLEALGIEKSMSEKVLTGVIDLVEERHILPKLRALKVKNRIQKDWEKLQEEISKEILPDGPRRFPEEFIKKVRGLKFKELSLPLGRLRLGESFFENQAVVDEEGLCVLEVMNVEEAKYIVYAKGEEDFLVKVPADRIVTKKAVQDYEFYLRDIREKLYRSFMIQSGDHTLSKNMTAKVLEDFGIPEID